MVPPIVDAAGARAAGWVAAWLATYALHSTLLLAAAWLLARPGVRLLAWRDLLWKLALAGGVATSAVQVAARPALQAAGAPSARAAGVSAAPAEFARSLPSPAPQAKTPVERPSPPLLGNAAGARWPLLLAAWVAGVGVMLLRLAVGRRRLLRSLGVRTPVGDGPHAALLDRLTRAAGTRRRVRLTSSADVDTPVALAGEICIPVPAFERLTPEQRESILAHELAHVLRGDPRWFAFGEIVRSLFFFQPLNGVAMRKLKENSEFLCDDAAVRQTGKRRALAECLAELAAGQAGARPGLATALGGERGSLLVQRVAHVLSGHAGRTTRVPRTVAALAAAAMVLAVAGFAPGVAAPAPLPAAPAAPAATGTVQPGEGRMGLLKRLQGGQEWEAEVQGEESHAGTVEVRYTLSANKVMLHRTRPEIVDVAPGGHFRLREESQGRVREVEVTPGRGGPRVVFRENGAEVAATPGLRAWMEGYVEQNRPRPSRRR